MAAIGEYATLISSDYPSIVLAAYTPGTAGAHGEYLSTYRDERA
jgi:hypothetical protein